MDNEGVAFSLKGAWRWWLIPATLSLVLALLYRDPFIGDWDALDYTVLSLRGQPSSMALGRSAFIFMNHALWRAAHALFNLTPGNAYQVFKGAIVLMSALGTIACWWLAREVTNSERTATVAALLLALSPSYILYSGQVMTEIPSLLLLCLALIIYLRGVRSGSLWLMLAGACLLGADVNMRETVGFYAPWLVVAPLACGWKLRRQEILRIALCAFCFVLFALGPFLVWFWTDAGGFRAAWYGWLETGKAEAARHPLKISNALPFLLFFFLTPPFFTLALPFAFLKEWRERAASILFALGAVGLFSNLLLILNYSTTINWRYFLTGLPALAPLIASFLMRVLSQRLNDQGRAFKIILASVALVAAPMLVSLHFLSKGSVEKHALMKSYGERLRLLPDDAVVMAGGQTVGVTYWRGVGVGRWDVIGTGAGWPGAGLVPLIESYLNNGRRVFLDADRRLWSPCGWQREETKELAQLETRFRFRRVSETIFEIRPAADNSAQDVPPLKSLLPESRAEEIKKCLPANRLSQ
jgi:hypothetical protein